MNDRRTPQEKVEEERRVERVLTAIRRRYPHCSPQLQFVGGEIKRISPNPNFTLQEAEAYYLKEATSPEA